LRKNLVVLLFTFFAVSAFARVTTLRPSVALANGDPAFKKALSEKVSVDFADNREELVSIKEKIRRLKRQQIFILSPTRRREVQSVIFELEWYYDLATRGMKELAATFEAAGIRTDLPVDEAMRARAKKFAMDDLRRRLKKDPQLLIMPAVAAAGTSHRSPQPTCLSTCPKP
jgi:hypothetical protein